MKNIVYLLVASVLLIAYNPFPAVAQDVPVPTPKPVEAGGAPPPAPAPSPPSPATPRESEGEPFVLLTGESGPFADAASGQNLPDFLNTIYRIAIGIAVVVAVLQIIRGGITWMLTDSVTEKGQAKHLVTIAVMGLVLVLSPVIVFSIINPCILTLSLTGGNVNGMQCEGSLGELRIEPSRDNSEQNGGAPIPAGTITQPGAVVTRAFSATEDEALSWEAGQNAAQQRAYKPNPEHRCKQRDDAGKCISYLTVSSPWMSPEIIFIRTDRMIAGEVPTVSTSYVAKRFYGSSANFLRGCKMDGGKVTDGTSIFSEDSSEQAPLSGVQSQTCPADVQAQIPDLIRQERSRYGESELVEITGGCAVLRSSFCKVPG